MPYMIHYNEALSSYAALLFHILKEDQKSFLNIVFFFFKSSLKQKVGWYLWDEKMNLFNCDCLQNVSYWSLAIRWIIQAEFKKKKNLDILKTMLKLYDSKTKSLCRLWNLVMLLTHQLWKKSLPVEK